MTSTSWSAAGSEMIRLRLKLKQPELTLRIPRTRRDLIAWRRQTQRRVEMGDHESRDIKAGYLDQPFVARMVGQVCCDASQTIVGDVKDRQQAPSVSFRPFTTKFDAVEPLLNLDHNRRTRMRVSVNAPPLVRFEGGTAGLLARLQAARRMAEAGYRVGLAIAPIMPVEGWREEYRALLDFAAATLCEVPGADLTIELITHRFAAGSKLVLTGWYPGSSLGLDEVTRAQKRTKYGSLKYVYEPEVIEQMRAFFMAELPIRLPEAQVPYQT